MQSTIKITPFPVCQPHPAAAPSWDVGVMPVPFAMEPLKKRLPAAASAPSQVRQPQPDTHRPSGRMLATEP
jgi:hypothetical protein